MNNNKKPARQIRPIRFSKLLPGSRFDIFAEPSRGIDKSRDTTVWEKMGEGWSEDVSDRDRVCILMPEDLVRPLSRPSQR
jgi:hypothetical protein